MARIRAVVHVHSNWSYDGSWSLPDLARAFARRRYDAVLMAEHDRGFDPDRWRAYRSACAEASDDRIVLVPGIEYGDAENAVHVPVWGDVPFLGEGLPTGELLERIQDARGIAMLAHPGRKGAWKLFEPSWARSLLGIELWNRKYDGYAPSAAAARLLEAHPGLCPLVGLDFHTARQFHPLALSLEIDAPVGEAAVCAALAGRRCRPTAFRLPAQHVARGPALRTMRGAERARKSVALGLRQRARSRA